MTTATHPAGTDDPVSHPIDRSLCRGMPPLDGRIEPWMVDVIESLRRHPEASPIDELIQRHGSPINLHHCAILHRNIDRLVDVAQRHAIDFQIFFARKANKTLGLVDAALETGIGVDVASLAELQQVLDRKFPPHRIICTAAIKTEALIELAVANAVVIAVDNDDEMSLVARVADRIERKAAVAIRCSRFVSGGRPLTSRFGYDVAAVPNAIENLPDRIFVSGLHFHLDGYDAVQRIDAIAQCLPLIEKLRAAGHPATFLDIGGGFPMSYLQQREQWEAFWQAHSESFRATAEAITYRHHRLGRESTDGVAVGPANVYPFWQTPTSVEWLDRILAAKIEIGSKTIAIAKAINDLDLQLRCEPGRSLLDGCGMTIATVEFVKADGDDGVFVGLAMNRTQCRTTTDDFMVDPIVVAGERYHAPSWQRQPTRGYFVGAYCTESELISLRRFEFPGGIARGDRVAFVNTAGYLMHFLESRSHQFELAKNFRRAEDQFVMDDIDRSPTNA